MICSLISLVFFLSKCLWRGCYEPWKEWRERGFRFLLSCGQWSEGLSTQRATDRMGTCVQALSLTAAAPSQEKELPFAHEAGKSGL